MNKKPPVVLHSNNREQEVTERVLEIAIEQANKAKPKIISTSNRSIVSSGMYDKLFHAVSKEISQLRVILESVEARERERVWITLQTQGELDDNRLIDGATGERNIFKKRGNQDPLFGAIQRKPKRLLFIMDVSSSMARFNSADRRLDRMAASTVMIMESFVGFEHKYEYSIIGQDGDSPLIPFVDFGKPPKNKSDRLLIINQMYANAMSCASGDHTLAAAHRAINDIVTQPADDYFVFVLSDANLRSYGINDKSLARILLANKQVNTYAIFIAGEQDAEMLTKSLPIGHAHVCLDTAKLPKIFKDIFAGSVLKSITHKL